MENKITDAVKQLLENDVMKKYSGKSNYGNPKTNYLVKITEHNDDELYEECKTMIWLSAYASNNSRSDYHWQCDACLDECERRGKPEIYTRAHKSVSSNN